MPIISDLHSKECKQLILAINNQSHIKKAVFVYDSEYNFIGKYEGVMQAEKTFKISHTTIKNCANIARVYKGYIFSYERLKY